MRRINLNRNWELSRPGNIFEKFGDGPARMFVDLPHDAMITEKRHADSPNGPDAAWYDGGTYIYEKELAVPADWKGKPVILEFEGIAQNAMVYVDGQVAGKCPYAYSDFTVEIGALLNYGGVSTIKAVAKTGMQQTSRWYSGSGMLRPAWLYVGGETQLPPDAIRFTTERCDETEAVVACVVTMEHTTLGRAACRLVTEILSPDGTLAAREDQPVTLFGVESAELRTRLHIPAPRLWDAEHPDLYTVTAKLLDGDEVLDEQTVRTGIRTVTADAKNGLRVNGKTVKLRGGAMHHDNGILGGVTYKDAELRRVRRMKEAGFNAIRSAHNPASKYLVEACDEVGMYLMDELFDVWNEPKRDHDYSLFFSECWERDMASLVRKDYNYPSVILYTMGNEIPETGTAAGASLNRKMAARFRALDGTRPIANCVNGMFSVMPRMREILAEVLGGAVGDLPTDINELMSMFDAHIDEIMRHDIVARATEETFAGMDVCGYNYMAARYAMDGEKYPNRVIVGSETNPDKIGYHWQVILAQDHVIGDFCWTGWDYIGEAGVGKNDYDMTHAMYGPWPWFLAYCGDHDICGDRRPQSYYREIVFGLRKAPYVAVERPEHYNQPKCVTNWTWPDVIESWTWPGFEGKRTHVEVYSDAESVALYINDRRIEQKPVGEDMPYKAIFDVVYEPGTLTAVSYRGGEETERMTLTTAEAPASVAVKPEASEVKADGMSLIYVDIGIVDRNGKLCPHSRTAVTLQIEGKAKLLGFGSADPATTERFDSDTHTVFDGRALAVLSAVEPGVVTVAARAEGLAAGSATVNFI